MSGRRQVNPWRAGARALARRWGTGDIMATEVGGYPGGWYVTDGYAMRIYGAGTVEADALTAYRDAHGIPEGPEVYRAGVWDCGALSVRVWRSGSQDMGPDRDLRRRFTARSISDIIYRASWPEWGEPTLVDSLVDDEDGLVDARDASGAYLATLAPRIVQCAVHEGDTLHATTPLKPVVVRDRDGELVGLVMPHRPKRGVVS